MSVEVFFLFCSLVFSPQQLTRTPQVGKWAGGWFKSEIQSFSALFVFVISSKSHSATSERLFYVPAWNYHLEPSRRLQCIRISLKNTQGNRFLDLTVLESLCHRLSRFRWRFGSSRELVFWTCSLKATANWSIYYIARPPRYCQGQQCLFILFTRLICQIAKNRHHAPSSELGT